MTMEKHRQPQSVAPQNIEGAGTRPGTYHSELSEALAFQHAGELELARKGFARVLEVAPKNVVALYSLAAIEANLGTYDVALSYADRAIAASPDFAQCHLARSIILMHLGRLDAAVESVERALKLESDLPGGALHHDALMKLKKQGTDSSSRSPQALLNHQALSAQALGDTATATKLFLKVLETEPSNFPALYSLGVIASQSGQSDAALAYMTRAASEHPQNAQAQYALGTILQGRGLFEDALAAFDRALTIDPSFIDACNNKATLLHSMNRQHDALLTTEAGLALAPDDQKLLNNKGYILTEFKLHAAAASVFRRVLDLNPEFDYAEGLHAFARLHSCDWNDYEANRQRIIEGVRAGKRTCNPLAFMALSDNAYDAKRCAEIFGQHRFPEAKDPLWRGEHYKHRRKRVAFISADFREHPVGYLLIGLIEHLDKAQFETVGISLGIRDGSDLYHRYRNAFDHYLDCSDKTSYEVAKLLRSFEIDIAIDLSGYTAGSRLDILAHRPAPVQMTYLGFPGTLGTPYVDYLLADRVTVPEELQPAYSEKILYLPHCYLPRDTSVMPAMEVPPKSHFGLPERGTVFCSFNHDYKISPSMYSVWMELLRERAGSVLWLMKLNEDAEKNLLRTTASFGVDPKRIVFATRVRRVEDHLARYRHVDVFLDTYPYNGHTTASDALHAGAPVVTMSGTSFASRVAASLLKDSCTLGAACGDVSSYRRAAYDLSEMVRSDQKKSSMTSWPMSSREQSEAFSRALLEAQKSHEHEG